MLFRPGPHARIWVYRHSAAPAAELSRSVGKRTDWRRLLPVRSVLICPTPSEAQVAEWAFGLADVDAPGGSRAP